MHSVLKRIEKANKDKAKPTPDTASKVIADQYIAEMKEEAREEARFEIQNQLINAANEAELEGALKQIKAMESEVNNLNNLLSNEKSQVTQLTDLVKSLKAEINNQSIAHKKTTDDHKTVVTSLQDQMKTLEMALLDEKTKPVPPPQVIQQEPRMVPVSFKAIPHRGIDGKTESVTLEPVYERPN